MKDMTQDISERFKSIFLEQRNKILETQEFIDEGIQLHRDEMLDEVDMSSVELEASMHIRLKNREALFLKKIDAALKRIEDGCFGQCRACEEEIELKRIEARPTTDLCVNCKEEEERIESLHIDGHRSKSLAKSQGSQLRLA